jgi:hypothetical protein
LNGKVFEKLIADPERNSSISYNFVKFLSIDGKLRSEPAERINHKKGDSPCE